MVDSEADNLLGGEAGPASPAVRERWDEGDSPSLAVVRAVADAADTDPTTLPPLQKTIDTDALDTLANGQGAGSAGWTRVSFAYTAFEVVVDSQGIVEVWPRQSN